MHFHARRTIFAFACLAVTFALSVNGSAQRNNDDWRAAQKKRTSDYLDLMDESTSLLWDSQQIRAWANCEGDDVVPRLLKIYDNPPAGFQTNIPYLAAAAVLERHDAPTAFPGTDYIPPRREPSESDVQALREFLKAHVKSSPDIWGVYCAACILALERDPEINMELLEYIGKSSTPAVNRAALLEALSRGGFEALRRVLEVLLDEKFKGSAEDTVLFEATVWAAARAYKPLHKPDQPVLEEWRQVFDGILLRLDNKKIHQRSIREAALALQYCFGTKHPYQYPAMWLQVFDSGKDPLGDDGRTIANFMGLDILGQRILFVIDASDSMLNPLTDEDKDAIRNPITQGKRDKKKHGDDGYEINWDRVRTRFDAAREHVKWTLSRLGKDKQVAVVLFGDKAEPLPFTRGFIDCSKTAIKKIYAALDSVRAGEPAENMKEKRPYGVLKGDTNYYDALLTAFRTGRSGIINSPREHWDLKLIEDGADSIFLLSDGSPITDGFSGQTPNIEYEYDTYSLSDNKQGEGEWIEIPGHDAIPEREVEVRDPETGIVTKRKIPGSPAVPPRKMWKQKIHIKDEYQYTHNIGPYANQNASSVFFRSPAMVNFLAELDRMNLVRRVQIHCVGIGEAQMGWLKPIAEHGRGQALFFGKNKEDDPTVPDLPKLPNPEDD